MTQAADISTLIRTAAQKQVLTKAVFSRPSDDAPIKTVRSLCAVGGKRAVRAESFLRGDTVSQKIVYDPELEDYLSDLIGKYAQINLITSLGEAEYKANKGKSPVLLGGDKLGRKLAAQGAAFVRELLPIDREKNYILTGKEPFLRVLGISDAAGRVHDKMQGKFRQINAFLEHLRTVEDKLPASGVLTVYDLCCGKSYLSFAVYHYFKNILQRDVRMLCVDLKEDVILYCGRAAADLGFDGMEFSCRDITLLPKEGRADLVISLHACDSATDIVLSTAVALGAKVILSTPCCQKRMARYVACPPLNFALKHNHLKEKLCATLTDALRASYLESAGYSVSVPELTDPNDTPKNTLLRAVKTHRADTERARREYEAICAYLFGEQAENYLEGTRCK